MNRALAAIIGACLILSGQPCLAGTLSAIRMSRDAVVSLMVKKNGEGEEYVTALGAGVIIDGDKKLAITNEHVVRDADSIIAVLRHGDQYPAKVIGSDLNFDLALLEIESPDGLPQIIIGRSDDLMLGETVLAIGNPHGYKDTVTRGVVSGISRTALTENELEDKAGFFKNVIQIDALTQPGNSGGALINVNGELIGIVFSGNKDEAFGFALAIDDVKKVIKGFSDTSRAPGRECGFEVGSGGATGQAKVSLVKPDNRQAGLKGLKAGDMVVGLNGGNIKTIQDYANAYAGLSDGREAKLTVLRDGQPLDFTFTPRPMTAPEMRSHLWRRYGVMVDEDRNKIKVVNIFEGGPFYRCGLETGDYLISLGGREMTRERHFWDAIMQYAFADQFELVVERKGQGYKALVKESAANF